MIEVKGEKMPTRNLIAADGTELIVSYEHGPIQFESFDAVTCSPSPGGFTFLGGHLGCIAPREQLEEACEQTARINEVCVLPWRREGIRVILAPNVIESGTPGREQAARLMLDLFNATQHRDVRACTLLITQFYLNINDDHLAGVLSEIVKLRNSSFGTLSRIHFNVASTERFERLLSYELR